MNSGSSSIYGYMLEDVLCRARPNILMIRVRIDNTFIMDVLFIRSLRLCTHRNNIVLCNAGLSDGLSKLQPICLDQLGVEAAKRILPRHLCQIWYHSEQGRPSTLNSCSYSTGPPETYTGRIANSVLCRVLWFSGPISCLPILIFDWMSASNIDVQWMNTLQSSTHHRGLQFQYTKYGLPWWHCPPVL